MSTAETIFVWAALGLYAMAFIVGLYGTVFDRASWTRGAVALALGAVAMHTGAIVARWIVTGHGPVMRTYENSLAGAWFLVVIWLIAGRHVLRLRRLMLAVLVIALLMLGNGLMSRPVFEPLLPPYQSSWLWVHVTFAWLSYGSFLIAAAAAGVYLYRHGRAGNGLAELDEVALKLVLFGFVSHTVMLGAGAIWAHGLWGRYWSWDPVETWSLITWIIYGLCLHLRFTMGWRERRAAWLTLGAAVAVLITFGGLGFTGGVHTRLL